MDGNHEESCTAAQGGPWNVTAEHPWLPRPFRYLPYDLAHISLPFCLVSWALEITPRRRGVCVLSLLRGCGEDCLCA